MAYVKTDKALVRLFRGDDHTPIESGDEVACDHRIHVRFGNGMICASCYARSTVKSWRVGPAVFYAYEPSESHKKDLALVLQQVGPAAREQMH